MDTANRIYGKILQLTVNNLKLSAKWLSLYKISIRFSATRNTAAKKKKGNES